MISFLLTDVPLFDIDSDPGGFNIFLRYDHRSSAGDGGREQSTAAREPSRLAFV
jgi:hypothetical protein